ncbi:hypothetical protein L1889_03665 [Paenalcaligenes niemegkensis]|uniref:hypothetical protein n=1 Tax=Paenalcaligenes niemegkensis TaxID=2895469 RepID=UPI001EE78E12|nr:hypothetical protein [Paenalcaligenes niemegkensis]MCQ9615907.1 hypothetical protein [Paenalcaligenes niemegkensis]
MKSIRDRYEPFVLGTLLPATATHAKAIGAPPNEVVFISFLALGAILQDEGFSCEHLCSALLEVFNDTHGTQEGSQ